MTYADLSDDEKRVLIEHANREHIERMKDPEFRRGWDQMAALQAAEWERDQLKALLREAEEVLDNLGACADPDCPSHADDDEGPVLLRIRAALKEQP